MQNIEELTNRIVKVRKVQGEEFFDILYTKAEIKEYLSKYSSSHKPTFKLYLDDKVITKEKGYLVTYKCGCGREIEIQLVRYLTKQTPVHCKHCLETEEKIKWHSDCIKMNHLGISYIHKTGLEKRSYDFESESEKFKQEYFEHNLTMDEFEIVKPHLFKVKDIEVKDKNVILLPHENGVNHKKYRQMLMINDKKVPFKDIYLRCSTCGRIFSITRMIKERVKNNNYQCKGCYLNNTVFAIKRFREGLTYQSKIELDFIKRCELKGIKIVDGFEIPYVFNNKSHIYRTDFFLPELKMIIEIKDMHVWHKNQIESGKWDEKEKAAKKYCEEKGLVYNILFPEDINVFFNSYERDSQNYNESCRS